MRGGPGNADQHHPATTSVLVSTVPGVPCPSFTGVSRQLRPGKMRPAALISSKPGPPWRHLEFGIDATADSALTASFLARR